MGTPLDESRDSVPSRPFNIRILYFDEDDSSL